MTSTLRTWGGNGGRGPAEEAVAGSEHLPHFPVPKIEHCASEVLLVTKGNQERGQDRTNRASHKLSRKVIRAPGIAGVRPLSSTCPSHKAGSLSREAEPSQIFHSNVCPSLVVLGSASAQFTGWGTETSGRPQPSCKGVRTREDPETLSK